MTNPAQSIACSSVLIIYSTASQLVAWIALAGALGFYDHKRAKGKDSRIPDIRVVDCGVAVLGVNSCSVVEFIGTALSDSACSCCTSLYCTSDLYIV